MCHVENILTSTEHALYTRSSAGTLDVLSYLMYTMIPQGRYKHYLHFYSQGNRVSEKKSNLSEANSRNGSVVTWKSVRGKETERSKWS